MYQSVELPESSLLLAGEPHVPTSLMSRQLRAAAAHAGPFYRPLESLSIADARQRRSEQSTAGIALEKVADLLHLAIFDTAVEGRRPYPAAGGIYSVHLFLVVRQVSGLASGAYYLRGSERRLEKIADEEAADRFRREGMLQEDRARLPLVGLLIADTRLARFKYADRAWRMAMIEAGALLQVLYMAGSRLGLSVCGLGGVADRAAMRLCRMQPGSDMKFACGISIAGPRVSEGRQAPRGRDDDGQ